MGYCFWGMGLLFTIWARDSFLLCFRLSGLTTMVPLGSGRRFIYNKILLPLLRVGR